MSATQQRDGAGRLAPIDSADAIMIVRGEDEQLALEMYNALDDQKLKK